MEAIFSGREPKSGLFAASDSVGVLYAAYLSAERKRAEMEVPLDPALGFYARRPLPSSSGTP
jgi:hypothetical protein